MICPDCGHDNVPGTDLCEGCGQDLTALDTPGLRSEHEEDLVEVPVARLGPRPPVLVPPDATVAEAVARLAERRIGAVLVGTPDELVGILTERDVLLRVADRYDELRDVPVSELMTRDPETLDAETPICHALNHMEVDDFRHLPITRAGRLAGVISLRDVVALLGTWYPDLIPADLPAACEPEG